MGDGGGCGLFLQWGVRCFWVEPFWVEMTQHNSLELIIRGTAPSSVYISISCRSESSNKSLVVLDFLDFFVTNRILCLNTNPNFQFQCDKPACLPLCSSFRFNADTNLQILRRCNNFDSKFSQSSLWPKSKLNAMNKCAGTDCRGLWLC